MYNEPGLFTLLFLYYIYCPLFGLNCKKSIDEYILYFTFFQFFMFGPHLLTLFMQF